ncbi:MAG TPA: hypothetical protein VKB68_06340 [Stellaceae bacterium]|nr:hypothetical protein [Stellaceae bacterium]
MRQVIVIAVLVMALGGTVNAQQRQLPPLPQPRATAPPAQPQTPAQSTQQQAAPDQRGTENSPVVVKVLPTPKTQEEAAQDQEERENKSSADRWMVRLTGLIALIGAIQAVVFWIQAGRLKDTIHKMDEIAAGQTADMKLMIGENAKTAAAMEQVAEGIAQQVTNATTLTKNQREFWQKQMRAYVGIVPGAAIEQDNMPGSHFECQPHIQNDGLTPAYDVIYRARCAQLPFPLPPNFNFALPDSPNPTRMTLNPRANSFMVVCADAYFSAAEYAELKKPGGRRLYLYGDVTYRDGMEGRHTTNFCFFFVWGGQGKPTYFRTNQHNESD